MFIATVTKLPDLGLSLTKHNLLQDPDPAQPFSQILDSLNQQDDLLFFPVSEPKAPPPVEQKPARALERGKVQTQATESSQIPVEDTYEDEPPPSIEEVVQDPEEASPLLSDESP